MVNHIQYAFLQDKNRILKAYSSILNVYRTQHQAPKFNYEMYNLNKVLRLQLIIDIREHKKNSMKTTVQSEH